jgi:PhnB protein
MAHVKPIPDGVTSVTPYLVVRGAAAAIEFYTKAFGAKERFRVPGAGGTIVHAEIEIGTARLYLADENPSRARARRTRLAGRR